VGCKGLGLLWSVEDRNAEAVRRKATRGRCSNAASARCDNGNLIAQDRFLLVQTERCEGTKTSENANEVRSMICFHDSRVFRPSASRRRRLGCSGL